MCSPHLIVDEPVSHSADGVAIHSINASEQLSLGHTAAVHQQVTTNGLSNICNHSLKHVRQLNLKRDD